MHFQYTPYIIPLILLALFSGWVMIYSWQRRRALNAAALSVMAFGIMEWLVGYALEIAGADYQTKLFWGKIQYIGIVLVPLMWAVFAYYHTQQGKHLNWRNMILLLAIPFITNLLIFTNEKHGLVWASVEIQRSGSFSALAVSHGIWFSVHLVYSYLLLLAGAVIIVRSLWRNMGLYRRQATALIIAVLAPWIGNALYLSGNSPIPNLDLTPFAFTITLAGLTWAIFGSQLVNISPIARDLIVDSMHEGMIVLDQRGYIVDINPAAGRMIGLSLALAAGKKFEDAFIPWPSLIERLRNAIDATDEIVIGEGAAQRNYEVNISSLLDNQKLQIGRIITLRALEAGTMPEPRYAVREPGTRPRLKLETKSAPARKRSGPLGWLLDFISTPVKTDFQIPPDMNPEWHQARERSFTLIMRVAALLGTVALFVTPFFIKLEAVLPFAIIIVFFWLLGVIRNVDFQRRAFVFLVLVYALAFIEMYNYGYSVNSFIFFLGLVVIATLLLGHFGGLITFLVTLITIGIFGILIGSGNFLPVHAYQGILAPETGQRAVISILVFTACAAALIAAVTILLGNLNRAWQLETQALNLLQQERDLLDQRVTERTAELAEARDLAVQSSNELRKYFRAIEQSGSSIVITDTKGNIEYANPRFEQSTGYTLAEAIGKNPRILKSGRQSAEYYAELWKTISGGHVWNGEFLNKRKDGSLYWESATIAPVMDQTGQVTNYVAIKDDITARRHAEEELRKLSSAVEQSGNTVIIMDRNGLIEYVNPKFSEVTGYSPAEAFGKPPATLMHRVNAPPDFHNDEWWQTVNAGQIWNGEFQNRRKDGSIFWESATIAPVQDQDGEVTNFVEIKQDITEQKILQAQLQKQNDYLSILHQITLDLLNRRDLSDLLQVIVDRSAVLLDAPFSELMLEKDDLLVVEAFTGNQPGLKGDCVTRDQARLSWQAFDTHQPVILEDYATWEYRREIYDTQQLHATAEFPVMAGEHCLGILSLGRSQPGYTFEAEQVETGILFARLVALVLDNANLYESAMREIAERARAEAQNEAFLNDIKALQKVNLELSEVEELNDLYMKMIDVCHHRMGIDRIGLFVLDPYSGDLCGTYGTDQNGEFRDERYYRETVDENHWTLEIANASNHTILWDDAPILDDGHEIGRGWKIATALWNGHKSIGYLVSDNFMTRRALRSYEVELVSLLGNTFGHLIERKRAENLLLESEARFRQIVENASDIIYRADTKGCFTYVNPTGLHTMGFSSEAQIIGKHYLDLVMPSMRKELQENFKHQLLDRAMNTYQEFIALTADGRELWIGQNVQLILADNEVSGFQAVARDITQLKQAQEAIALSRDQALEASQLKTQLLSRVSHELRTPLSSILGYAELFNAGSYGALNEEQKKIMKRIADSARYLSAMINDLLDEAQMSSKNIALHNEPFSPSALLENIRARTTVLAQNKSLYLNTEIDPRLPETMYGDEKRLQQIIINLVGNAIKFTRGGGVQIRLYAPDSSRWAIQVIDTGSGIPEEDQRYIFDAFRQVNNAITRENRGTGLGLSIVKQLVEIMDGSIQLTSKVGEGSTFTIILPILTPREMSK